MTIPSVSKQFGIAYHTAQADIERFTSVGILHEVLGEYPRTFFAREILRVAFGTADSSGRFREINS
jgi:hypothetical protein